MQFQTFGKGMIGEYFLLQTVSSQRSNCNYLSTTKCYTPLSVCRSTDLFEILNKQMFCFVKTRCCEVYTVWLAFRYQPSTKAMLLHFQLIYQALRFVLN